MNTESLYIEEKESKKERKNKIAEYVSKLIRGLTVPPVIAFFMLTYFYLSDLNIYRGFGEYALAVFFITLLPASAYIVQIFLKDKFPGNDGKRTLAMIFSVTGYVLGAAAAVIMGSSTDLLLIYLCYLISGSVILVLSKVMKFRISGHAVGSAGPIAILLGFGQPVWIIGIPVLLSVFYSSLKIKRHTKAQILCGIMQPFLLFPILTSFIRI